MNLDFVMWVLAWLMMIGIISLLVIVHECGHFLVARMFGFQTPVFGIGLPVGPYIVVGHGWGTQFRIHYALLGGYVAIPELGDESQHDAEAYGVPLNPFKKFPIWQRALVAFAGVGFNILFAYLIMFMMLMIQGEPITQTFTPGLDKNNPIALNAGVKPNDVIVSINDEKVNSSTDVVTILGKHKAEPVTLHLLREEKPVDITLTPNEKGKVGMMLDVKQVGFKPIEKSPPEIAVMAADELGKLTGGMLQALGMMGQGLANYVTHIGQPPKTGETSVGPGDVHGILAVMKLGSDIAKEQDWNRLFIFTILISMDLAIVNLVPWPALDGGHLAFMFIELVRGKPMGEKAQGEIFRWGLLSLLLLMVVIMVNDVTALVTGKLDFKKNKQEKLLKDKDGKDVKAPPGDAALPADGAKTPADTAAPTDGKMPAEGAAPTDAKTPAAETPATDASTDAKTPAATDGQTPAATDAKTPAATDGKTPAATDSKTPVDSQTKGAK
jgi:membrane-associated protease RseP (regulator of RpoE activity)